MTLERWLLFLLTVRLAQACKSFAAAFKVHLQQLIILQRMKGYH